MTTPENEKTRAGSAGGDKYHEEGLPDSLARAVLMTARTQPLLHYLRRLITPSSKDAGDAELLERFVSESDESAFAALLARHGPMVFGVCRRVLRDSNDAEDAFQATFLILARKARALRRPEALASWLYGTARRLASAARRTESRRRQRETNGVTSAVPPSEGDLLDDLSARELLLALDEELARLPETYRLPLILCHLEGRTHEEAARLLGWTAGSVKGRLERGRKQLHSRLSRRGLALSGAILALGVSQDGTSAVAARLTSATLRAALAFARGERDGIAATVLTLVESGLTTMIPAKVTMGLSLLLLMSLVAGSGALAMRHSPTPPGEQERPSAQRPVMPAPSDVQAELDGDPLPPGAIAQMGTIRFRHIDHATSVAFSPDSKLLASADAQGGPVILWDAATGRELRRVNNELPNPKRCPIFSPDGKRMATTTWGERQVRFWDVATGKELRPLKIGAPLAFSVRTTFSADGKILAVPDESKVIHLMDVASGAEIRQLKEHPEKIESLAFSPDGKLLAAGGDGATIVLWETATGKPIRHLHGREKKIPSVVFSHDGKELASAGHDGTVRLWDLETGTEKQRFKFEKGETEWDCAVAAVLYVPGTRWLTAGGIKSVRVWDLATGREIRRFPGHWSLVDCPMAVSPDGKMLAEVWEFGQILVSDLASGKRLCEPEGHQKGICSVVFSPDGKTLASGSADRTLRLWDAASGKEKRRLTLPDNVRAVFSPDARCLIGSCNDQFIHIWDAATGEERRRFPLHKDDYFHSLIFSSDGRTVALTSTDNLIRLWRVDTGEAFRRLVGHKEGVKDMAFSPDGKMLASVGWGYKEDKTARLWDIASGKEIRQFRGHENGLNCIAFSPDGKTVAAGGRDRVIYLWDADTGAKLRQFVCHKGCIESLRFSPDGRILASGDNIDFGVHLWEVATGQERTCFRGHRNHLHALDFSLDGRRLASAGEDAIILVWDVTGGITAEQKGVAHLTEQELGRLWDELGDTKDAARAYQAMSRLLRDPAATMRLFREQLHPVPAAEMTQVRQWIADLDSPEFAVREKAMRELERRVEAVEGALRKVLEGRTSLEVRQRVKLLLDKRDLTGMDKRELTILLRSLRAVEILEHFDTDDAQELLKTLAGGAAEARLTQEAKASLTRLAARSAVRP
jgi:RNA polymerase sigma factor (sigma-70 family)